MRALMERMAIALERIADSVQGNSQKGDWTDMTESRPVMSTRVPNEGESKQVQAMKLLAELGPDNLSRIAEAIHVNRRTLYKWPVFMEAVERLRAAEQWVPRAVRARAPEDL